MKGNARVGRARVMDEGSAIYRYRFEQRDRSSATVEVSNLDEIVVQKGSIKDGTPEPGPANRLDHECCNIGLLHLNHGTRSTIQRVERLGQRWNLLIAYGGTKAAQIFESKLSHVSAPIRRAINPRIMHRNQAPIAGALDVNLDCIHSDGERLLDGTQRVFWGVTCRPAVTNAKGSDEVQVKPLFATANRLTKSCTYASIGPVSPQ